MSEMLKISEAANLAMHGMALLAARKGRAFSTKEMSTKLHVSEAHLSKVLQRLAKVGYVTSVRGPKGGFTLADGCEELTLLDVYEAVEGTLETRRCLLGEPLCDGKRCVLGSLMVKADELIRRELDRASLSEVAKTLVELVGKV